MRYLIDGNNLIGHSRDLNLSSPDCRAEAMSRVADFCRRNGARATIFFDGGPDVHVGERGVALGPVRALLAGKGVEADTRILRMIERAAGDRFTVVSSDRRIYGRARAAGLPVLRIHEFNALVDQERRRAADGAEHRAELDLKSRRLDPDEIEEWLRIFSDDS